ncbi:MAG: glycerate kinase [Deltaproteobacteria bacterium]|jgi:glycerate kinase|nr:glycerate kinase [Deltaproteobacteria bacterium]
MKIVVAPDSFKGSLSALEAARRIGEGLARVWPRAEIVLFPIADGGEGTVATMMALTNGRPVTGETVDPLGRPVRAEYGFLGGTRTAVVEMAAASGLTRLSKQELDPLRASTYGFGLQIRQALAAGAEKLIAGLGGSATNDCGVGMLAALGLRLFDRDGNPVEAIPAMLKKVARIDASGLLPEFAAMPILVASDVQNPLVGPDGASAVFGPQKGATPDQVPVLDDCLRHFATLAGALVGRDVLESPGAGAAGGLGAAFKLFTACEFKPGVEVVLTEGRFLEKAKGANLIVTGEGRSDGQTIWGKAPVGVAALGRRLGAPTVCLAGGLGEGYEKMYQKDIAGLMPMLPGPLTLEEAMAGAGPILAEAAERLGRLVALTVDQS